jgi:cystathionine beta-lyase family protein involved in aluminum resistance
VVQTDRGSDILVKNATVKNSQFGGRIKTYPGGSSFGISVVQNTVWDDVTIENNGYAVYVDACYGVTIEECSTEPGKDVWTGVKFINFSGTTSTL